MYISVADLAQTVDLLQPRSSASTWRRPGEARPTSERIQAFFGDKTLATMRTARGTFPGQQHHADLPGVRRAGPEGRAAPRAGSRRADLPVTVQDFPAVVEQVKANGGIIGVGDTSASLAADARSSGSAIPMAC